MKILNKYSLGQIQKSEEKEAKEIIELVLKEYGLFEEDSPMDIDLKNISKHYKDDYFGVVRYDSKVIGTFAIIGLDEQTAEIRKMYLLREHRGRGMGSKILNHLLNYARENGFSRITLETASVLVEAIGLYRKMGFIEIINKNASPRCDRQFEFSLNK